MYSLLRNNRMPQTFFANQVVVQAYNHETGDDHRHVSHSLKKEPLYIMKKVKDGTNSNHHVFEADKKLFPDWVCVAKLFFIDPNDYIQ